MLYPYYIPGPYCLIYLFISSDFTLGTRHRDTGLLIPAFRKLRQEHYEFKTSLGYRGRPCHIQTKAETFLTKLSLKGVYLNYKLSVLCMLNSGTCFYFGTCHSFADFYWWPGLGLTSIWFMTDGCLLHPISLCGLRNLLLRVSAFWKIPVHGILNPLPHLELLCRCIACLLAIWASLKCSSQCLGPATSYK